ncbi:hypothetical protein [uncultured Acinetobacter sp.]|uniref:hypothetical protein n=1 Tax=uncultured Acinetobacter sp. TaxID=165433 RepID=UPI0026126B5B|nr:hypothetical protein [uncultured Acinetobacter sp.]
MLKMTDVLSHSLVQNFTQGFSSLSAAQLDEQLNQSILNASDHALARAVAAFFERPDALQSASALDISLDAIQALKQGIALKAEYLSDTLKIAALCLALETNALEQLDIAEPLQDFPI